jgi:L-ascorbate metabolism protein UlaG (beta-lactamase superfamily)
MPIGAYNPWIHSHCTPEEAVQMANEAGARFIMPVHHQTFCLSAESFREPIERFKAAASVLCNPTSARVKHRHRGLAVAGQRCRSKFVN